MVWNMTPTLDPCTGLYYCESGVCAGAGTAGEPHACPGTDLRELTVSGPGIDHHRVLVHVGRHRTIAGAWLACVKGSPRSMVRRENQAAAMFAAVEQHIISLRRTVHAPLVLLKPPEPCVLHFPAIYTHAGRVVRPGHRLDLGLEDGTWVPTVFVAALYRGVEVRVAARPHRAPASPPEPGLSIVSEYGPSVLLVLPASDLPGIQWRRHAHEDD